MCDQRLHCIYMVWYVDQYLALITFACCRCMCGQCSVMNTERESICCKEIEQLIQLLDGMETVIRPDCNTEHVDFSTVCLIRAVLTVALYNHLEQVMFPLMKTGMYFNYFIIMFHSFLNRRFWYLAYRQLVCWGWEYLGRSRRVVPPSCAVSKVQSEFPSEEYTGHQDAPATS